jgi:hypothetical protein
MKKILTMFIRGSDHKITPQINPECQWVFDGQGIATRKWDGTSCLVKNGQLYKRYDLKPGRKEPGNFVSVDDSIEGHNLGWIPVSDSTPADKHHRKVDSSDLPDGTYELCGPKINGNPENFQDMVLIRHGAFEYNNVPREFEALKDWLSWHDIEGLVWHHPDGRMAKIKKKDFGLNRKGK